MCVATSEGASCINSFEAVLNARTPVVSRHYEQLLLLKGNKLTNRFELI